VSEWSYNESCASRSLYKLLVIEYSFEYLLPQIAINSSKWKQHSCCTACTLVVTQWLSSIS